MRDDLPELAFPQAVDHPYIQQVSAGMTLRDYFAAKALQSIMSYSEEGREPPNTHHAQGIAQDAYKFADAMLAARAAIAKATGGE